MALVKKIVEYVVLPVMLTLQQVSAQTNTPANDSKVPPSGVAVYRPAAYTGGMPVNYIRTWQPRQPYTLESDVISSVRSVTEVNHTTRYIDGLGRPLQTVNWQGSPSQKDFVAPIVYDMFGREQYKFLPYASSAADGLFKTDPFGDQSTFYSAVYPSQQAAYANESVYYGKTIFEASPLNRVQKTFAPGNSWAGSEGSVAEHTVQMQYLINNSNDQVRIWIITNNSLTYSNNDQSTNIPVTTATYAAGQLYKMVTIDEAGHAVVEYKDKEGKVVLKKVQIGNILNTDYSGQDANWLCTYYVYDDFGLLRFVIPPKATAQIAASWQLSTDIVNELCFRYEYDARNRMIAKKVPGAGWVYMIYDKRDRLVFTQDANMRNSNQWLYTLYDGLNRPVQTGMMAGYTGSPADLQNYVNSNTGSGTISTVTTNGINMPPVPGDVTYTMRNTSISAYQATSSITFDNDFTSEDNAGFTAEIVPGSAGPFTVTATVVDNPLPGGTTNTALTLNFYDDYSQTSKTYNNSNNSKLDIGNNLYGEPLPPNSSSMTKGMVTVSRVRVIENPSNLSLGNWMETATFYDDKGRAVQVQSDNYKGGLESITTRYNFSNQPITLYQTHTNPAAYVNTSTKTNMDYDHAERLLAVRKTINDDGATTHTITQNSYDALGQLQNKKLGLKKNADGSLGTEPLEIQDYAYNIRGWLKGMNWNYGALSGPTTSQMNISNNKWFAMDLSYDWGFGSNEFNGNIAGQRWQSAGDGAERAFGYGYDAANRILFADFNQKFSSWAKADPVNASFTIDFSTKMGDGSTAGSAYDENGNIRAMQQKGLLLNSSSLIDNLTYTYNSNSNKLQNVVDAQNNPQTMLGDFRSSAAYMSSLGGSKTGSATDYTYDNNGNLVKDLNKDIGGSSTNGITYNHLNLPYQVTVQNKGTITYIYDAAGNKLEKRTMETSPQSKATTTTYIGGYVYENNTLQFFAHEEGRVRVTQGTTAGQSPSYTYDYFIKDHLGNVRMVLTDEQQSDMYPAATMETAQAATEELLYANLNATRIDKPVSYPVDNTTSPNAKVAKVSAAAGSQKVGPSITLKVMAGDKFNIKVSSWYKTSGATPGTPVSPLPDLLAALINGVSGASGGKVATTQLQSSGVLTPGATNFLNSQTPDATRPKAYLNWILFDEQFNFVSSNSGFEQVPAETAFGTVPNQTVYNHVKSNLTIDKCGYLYIYVSNETPNIDVFFDNLQVTHIRGPLVEETHYYPFGLAMAGISSKAAGKLENKYKYNGIELDTTFGIDEYEAHFRNLDVQDGRWWQIDPKIEEGQESISPYAAMSNNPVLRSDPLGDLDGECCKELWKDIKDAVKETGRSIYEGAVTVATKFNELVNPLPNAVELITGKSFESGFTEPMSRITAAGGLLIAVLPGGKEEGAMMKAAAKGLDKTVAKDVVNAVGKEVNANSKASTKLNTLYRLETKQGEYLKTGITSKANPEKRYTKSFMADKQMKRIDQGSRTDMLKKEREIVEKNPGPLNKEPWAGKSKNE